MWDKFGAGFDLRTLPERDYQAHFAIIAGHNKKQNEDAEKARRKK